MHQGNSWRINLRRLFLLKPIINSLVVKERPKEQQIFERAHLGITPTGFLLLLRKGFGGNCTRTEFPGCWLAGIGPPLIDDQKERHAIDVISNVR